LFLALKTEGRVRERAVGPVRRGGLAVVVVGGAFLVWTELAYGAGWTIVSVLAAAGALLGALWLVNRRDGWAFALTAIAIIAVTVTLFGSLYPDVLPSSTDPANSLNTTNAASTAYTLTITTWVAVVFTPIVLAYQSWSPRPLGHPVAVDLARGWVAGLGSPPNCGVARTAVPDWGARLFSTRPSLPGAYGLSGGPVPSAQSDHRIVALLPT
jgi:hypothetical protein